MSKRGSGTPRKKKSNERDGETEDGGEQGKTLQTPLAKRKLNQTPETEQQRSKRRQIPKIEKHIKSDGGKIRRPSPGTGDRHGEVGASLECPNSN